MRRAAGILGENLRQALPGPDGGAAPGTGPLTDDRELAGWLQRRLDNEVELVDEAAASAAAAAALLNGASTPAHRAPPAGQPAPRASANRAPAPDGGARHRRPRVAVVFTAIGVEYRAFREHLDAPQRREERGGLYEVGMLAGTDGPWQVALAETGPGSARAACASNAPSPGIRPRGRDLPRRGGRPQGRRPRGRGGSGQDLRLRVGQVDAGRLRAAAADHQPADRLLQWARSVANEDRWQRRIQQASPEPPPACHVKPIVTGAKVIAHDQSQTALQIGRLRRRRGGGRHGRARLPRGRPHESARGRAGNPGHLRPAYRQRQARRRHLAAGREPAPAAFAIEFLNSIAEKAT